MASVCKRLAAGRAVYRDEGEEGEEGGEESFSNDNDDEENEAPVPPQEEGGGGSSAVSSKGDKKILIMSLLEGSKNRRQRAWAVAEPPHVVIGNPRALSRLVEQVGGWVGVYL